MQSEATTLIKLASNSQSKWLGKDGSSASSSNSQNLKSETGCHPATNGLETTAGYEDYAEASDQTTRHLCYCLDLLSKLDNTFLSLLLPIPFLLNFLLPDLSEISILTYL